MPDAPAYTHDMLTRDMLEWIDLATIKARACDCPRCWMRVAELRCQYDTVQAEHEIELLHCDIAAVERGELS